MSRLLLHRANSRILSLVHRSLQSGTYKYSDVAGGIIAASSRNFTSSGITGTDDDDDRTAWVPPTRSEKVSGIHSAKKNILRDDRKEDDFEFTPAAEIDEDGKVTQFVDLEALLNNPEMVEKIMQNQNQNEGIIDVSERKDEVGHDESLDNDAPNWDWARRKKPNNENLPDAIMMTPKEIARARYLDGEIPPIPKTLLSTEEILSSLVTLGAQNVVVLPVSHLTEMTEHFVIATCFSAR